MFYSYPAVHMFRLDQIHQEYMVSHVQGRTSLTSGLLGLGPKYHYVPHARTHRGVAHPAGGDEFHIQEIIDLSTGAVAYVIQVGEHIPLLPGTTGIGRYPVKARGCRRRYRLST